MRTTDRRRHDERTRREILRVAAAEIGSRGYEAVSMAEIAARVDAPRSVLHHHYVAKNDVAADIVAYQAARWDQMRERVGAAGLTGLRAVLGLLQLATRQLGDEPHARAAVNLLVGARTFGLDPVMPSTDWPGTIRRSIEEARSAGEVRASLDAGQAAESLLDVGFGTLVQHPGADGAELLRVLRPMWEAALSMMGVADPVALLDSIPDLDLPEPPALHERLTGTR